MIEKYTSKKVSIITAVFNSENFFEETIESVLNQTHKNWEWLIIDDCSQDGTVDLIEKYEDDRIRLIKLDINKGAAKARNIGLEFAENSLIAFIDADDVWTPNKLEEQLKFMLKNDYGFTYTSYKIMGKKNRIRVPRYLNYQKYMKNTIIGMFTVMIDRNKIGDFRIVDIRKDHDSMTWAKLLRTNMAYGLDECLGEYRKVEGSISNNKLEAIKNHWKNCRNIEKLGVLKCSYYFVFYCLNAAKKHFLIN